MQEAEKKEKGKGDTRISHFTTVNSTLFIPNKGWCGFLLLTA